MELHAGRLPGLLLDLDLGHAGDEAHLVERLLVLLGPIPAFGRSIEVVESDARADDVQDRVPLCLRAAFINGTTVSCRPRTNAPRMRAPTMASMHRSKGGMSFASPVCDAAGR